MLEDAAQWLQKEFQYYTQDNIYHFLFNVFIFIEV